LPAYLCRTLKIKRLRCFKRRPEGSMSDNATSPVAVTDRAARRVAAILAKEAPGSALRVAVNGGGCSGFQYAFDVTQEREAEDLVIEKDGAVVLVDSVSLDFLRGTRIDFVDDLIGQSFKIDNPNVKASCGCGASFTV
jgi:iron-sulfur cluster assembly accessory protein